MNQKMKNALVKMEKHLEENPNSVLEFLKKEEKIRKERISKVYNESINLSEKEFDKWVQNLIDNNNDYEFVLLAQEYGTRISKEDEEILWDWNDFCSGYYLYRDWLAGHSMSTTVIKRDNPEIVKLLGSEQLTLF